MGDLGMLNLTNIPRDRTGYGSRVVVVDVQRSVEVEYKLLAARKPMSKRGSSRPPPDRPRSAHRKVGDEVHVATPAGEKEFEVVRLVTIHEED